MNKYFKVTVCIFAAFALILILSPFISLFLPSKLTNRTYYRLIYSVIAEKETKGCFSDEEKALRLFRYVTDHEFHQGTPYECKPAESLIYAQAYCDFEARTLNELLGVLRIPCRYAMLLDKDGISPHTLNEVFLSNKWRVFDTAMNIIFRDKSGNLVSLEELSKNPGIIFADKKLIILKEYSKPDYECLSECYHRVFPIPLEPRRSTPVMYKYHIFDYIADAYFKIFKYNFTNFYQDAYLGLNKNKANQEDFNLFLRARNYHLCYRNALALRYYGALLKKYPRSKYAEDAIFFRATLYFDLKDFPKAIGSFRAITDKSSKWRSAAYYYLGRSYGLIGDDVASLTAYNKASVFNLSGEILEKLDKQGLRRQ